MNCSKLSEELPKNVSVMNDGLSILARIIAADIYALHEQNKLSANDKPITSAATKK